jgi:predicted glycosyltransferase
VQETVVEHDDRTTTNGAAKAPCDRRRLGLAAQGEPGGRPPTRIAIYSHDAQGLGHIRRNMLIARALSRAEVAPILLLSGLRESAAFPMPPGVDCLTLPALGKDTEGRYFPRSLGVPMDDLMRVRTDTIKTALRSFAPDVLLIDKLPLGAFGELEPSLRWLGLHGSTRIVLGLRDILDDADVVHQEWTARGDLAAIRRYFEQIWIYGDEALFDVVREYAMPEDVADLIRYSGYLNPRDVDEPEPVAAGDGRPDAPLTLCVVGGGSDGLPLAEAFLGAMLRSEDRGLLVTGPLMPVAERRRLGALAAGRPGLQVREFVTDPRPLLREADHVIAMGGYNTMCEIVAYGSPALIVPRVAPRTEQLILPDFGGVQRLPALLNELLACSPGPESSHAAS